MRSVIHCLAACVLLALSFSSASSAFAQQRDVNGARNSAADGTSLDTNVSFTLRMTLLGDETPRGAATLGDDVRILTTIRPDPADIGRPADIIIVDYIPGSFLRMRNTDGNFVNWNGSLRTLVPSVEGVNLTDELDVEVFNGRLGQTGNHRVFVGFLVDDVLYFTPSALRFDITEAVSARDQAISLFNSAISQQVVHGVCIACHVAGGAASGLSSHIFVRTTNANHLTINFGEFEEVHGLRGTDYILRKVQGMENHGGAAVLSPSGSNFMNLQDFLELLDAAAAE